MATRYTDEFCRDAVRIATTSGLTRPQTAADLGVGLSTLNKWVQKPLGIRTNGRINEFRDWNVSATSPFQISMSVSPGANRNPEAAVGSFGISRCHA